MAYPYPIPHKYAPPPFDNSSAELTRREASMLRDEAQHKFRPGRDDENSELKAPVSDAEPEYVMIEGIRWEKLDEGTLMRML